MTAVLKICTGCLSRYVILGLMFATFILPLSGASADIDNIVVPETIPIPAGVFWMGMNTEADPASNLGVDGLTGATPLKESPAHEVSISAFEIGLCEVTNEEYAEFVDAGGYDNKDFWIIDEEDHEKADAGWNWKNRESIEVPRYLDYITDPTNPVERGWNLDQSPYWKSDPFSSDNDTPVVGVSWYEAFAYCKWLSSVTGSRYRLPTEAEWEYAARGPESNIFPWGNEYLSPEEMCGMPESGAMANCWVKEETSQRMAGDITVFMEVGGGKATPVGSYPEGMSSFGLYDMAGNVAEWTGDWFQILYYPRRVKRSMTADPPGPSLPLSPFIIPFPPFWIQPCRTLRSQGFIQDPVGASNYSRYGPTYPLRCSHRQFVKRFGGSLWVGFRVVKENTAP